MHIKSILKKTLALILSLSVCLTLFAGCTKSENGAPTVILAYQGGIGYAPFHIVEKSRLIEKHFGKEVNVVFKKLDSGVAINEGIIGGKIAVGGMGLAPAISVIAAGVPCKIFTGLCAQPNSLFTNKSNIKSLADIKKQDKIAIVKEGSVQHIFLSMAAKKYLGDAHALDENIQSMSHAEGMAALESGTVALHLTTMPFLAKEREQQGITELDVISQVWSKDNTFLVATASEEFKNKNPELFAAVDAAFKEAIEIVNSGSDEVAEIESEYLSLEKETVKKYLTYDGCKFFAEVVGGEEMTKFMYDEGFITNYPDKLEF